MLWPGHSNLLANIECMALSEKVILLFDCLFYGRPSYFATYLRSDDMALGVTITTYSRSRPLIMLVMRSYAYGDSKEQVF